MSVANVGATLPGAIASADLSADQFKIVKIDTSGEIALSVAAATDSPAGVLHDKPLLGDPALVYGPGSLAKVFLGATVAPGALVASDANGLGVAAVGGDFVLGICKAGGDVGEVAEVYITFSGKA